MHCAFRVGASTILASDGCSDDAGFKGVWLALTVPTIAEADWVFSLLADTVARCKWR